MKPSINTSGETKPTAEPCGHTYGNPSSNAANAITPMIAAGADFPANGISVNAPLVLKHEDTKAIGRSIPYMAEVATTALSPCLNGKPAT